MGTGRSLVGRKVRVIDVKGYDSVLTGHLNDSVRVVEEEHGGTVSVKVPEYLDPNYDWALLESEYELVEDE
jgi:hypothetical protein